MARILVIDDEQVLRRSVVEILEREGHEVLDAADGKVGMQLLREQRPDLVISDLFMPEMDGVELLRQLRRESPELKVVVMSGGAYDGQIQLLDVATGLGAAAVLRKPFELEELVSVVNEVLGR